MWKWMKLDHNPAHCLCNGSVENYQKCDSSLNLAPAMTWNLFIGHKPIGEKPYLRICSTNISQTQYVTLSDIPILRSENFKNKITTMPTSHIIYRNNILDKQCLKSLPFQVWKFLQSDHNWSRPQIQKVWAPVSMAKFLPKISVNIWNMLLKFREYFF